MTNLRQVGLTRAAYGAKAQSQRYLTLLFCTFLSWFGQAALATETAPEAYAQTRYPIVMVPGAFSFDNVLGVVDYWYGITDELRAQGADVYVTNLSSSGPNIARGEQLLEDVRKILALTGAKRVNLIAHSQGGTAARYVASLKPEWIESVTCVVCLNEGTTFADNLYAFLNDKSFFKTLVNIALSWVFSALEVFSSLPTDGSYNSDFRGLQIAEDLVIAAGTQNVQEFNERFPAALSHMKCKDQTEEYSGIGGDAVVDNVAYSSWGSNKVVSNLLDPLDSILVPVVQYFYGNGPSVWDGLAPSCGHPLGVLTEGNYPLNHYDAINQTFGFVGSEIDVPSIYTLNANRLRNEGH